MREAVHKLQIRALVREREPKLVLVYLNMSGYSLWQLGSV